jgi:hypothetical protein
MAPPAGSWTWKTESQTEGFGPGPDGKIVEGVRVGLVTALGVHGSIFIAKAGYSAAAVKAAAEVWYAHIDAVARLTS